MWVTSKNKYNEEELRIMLRALILYHEEVTCDENLVEDIIVKLSEEIKEN